MSTQKFKDKRDAKDAGWFSRRHRTREDRRIAMENHETNKPPPKRSRWNGKTWVRYQ